MKRVGTMIFKCLNIKTSKKVRFLNELEKLLEKYAVDHEWAYHWDEE